MSLTDGDRGQPAEDDEDVDPAVLVLVLRVGDRRRHGEVPERQQVGLKPVRSTGTRSFLLSNFFHY